MKGICSNLKRFWNGLSSYNGTYSLMKLLQNYSIFSITSKQFQIYSLGIPNVYQGNLHQTDEVLEWIIGEISGDHTVEVRKLQFITTL